MLEMKNQRSKKRLGGVEEVQCHSGDERKVACGRQAPSNDEPKLCSWEARGEDFASGNNEVGGH